MSYGSRNAQISLIFAVVLTMLPAQANATRPGPERVTAGPSPTAPVIQNPGLECSEGTFIQPGIEGRVPAGWTARVLQGRPRFNSARIQFAGNCNAGGFVERLEGLDSLVFISQDIETPPLPGKPFDALVYQQVAVTPGTAYSLSGWLVSLCGGSAIPNDCPPGYYIDKLLGADPRGSTDPLAPEVIWVEDQRNFTTSGWANLRLAVTAETSTLTLFARIRSPFRWHGAHAFVDAISLVRAPEAYFVSLPAIVTGGQLNVRWDGTQSPDVAAIPGGTYRLLFDIQFSHAASGGWTDWLIGQPAGQALFAADSCPSDQTIRLRVRARAEQVPGIPGAWPNHRYPGPWSQPSTVQFQHAGNCSPQVYLPRVGN